MMGATMATAVGVPAAGAVFSGLRGSCSGGDRCSKAARPGLDVESITYACRVQSGTTTCDLHLSFLGALEPDGCELSTMTFARLSVVGIVPRRAHCSPRSGSFLFGRGVAGFYFGRVFGGPLIMTSAGRLPGAAGAFEPRPAALTPTTVAFAEPTVVGTGLFQEHDMTEQIRDTLAAAIHAKGEVALTTDDGFTIFARPLFLDPDGLAVVLAERGALQRQRQRGPNTTTIALTRIRRAARIGSWSAR